MKSLEQLFSTMLTQSQRSVLISFICFGSLLLSIYSVIISVDHYYKIKSKDILILSQDSVIKVQRELIQLYKDREYINTHF